MKPKDNELVSKAPRKSLADYVNITVVATGPNWVGGASSQTCPRCRVTWHWTGSVQNISCTCGWTFQVATSSPTYMKSHLQQPRYGSSFTYTRCPHCQSSMAQTGKTLAPDVYEYECSGLTGARHTVVVKDDITPRAGISMGHIVP